MKSTKRLDADQMARLTFLVSAEVKRELDRLCAEEDLTTSQVLRRLIASHLEQAVMKSQGVQSLPSSQRHLRS